MRDLFKLKNYINFNNNKLVKLYLLSFYILNVIYLCLEISKNKLHKLFFTYPDQQKFYFEKISNISNITTSIVSLILIINVLYLVLNLIKYKNKKDIGLNEYLIISIITTLSIKIVSSMLLAIFSTYYLLEPNIAVTEFTLLVLIVTLVKRAYKFIISRSRHQIL